MLRKVECYLVPSNLEKLRDLLVKMGVDGMSVTDARGFGTRSPVKNGAPQLEERVRVDIVVDVRVVDDVINGIKNLVGEGDIGAGMCFVIPVEDAVRLRTREHGKSALF